MEKSLKRKIAGVIVLLVALAALALIFKGPEIKDYFAQAKKNVAQSMKPKELTGTDKNILEPVDLAKDVEVKKSEKAKTSAKPAKKDEKATEPEKVKVKVTVEDGDTTGDEEQVDLEDGTVGEVSLADYEDSLADMSKKELRAEKKKVKVALADMKKAVWEEGYISSGPVGDILVIEEDDDQADVQYKSATMDSLLISIDENL